MTIIGIDMSKNSPGVCVRKGSELTFLSFIRGSNKGKIASHYQTLDDANVKIHFYEYSQPSKMEYSDSEVWKSVDAQRYAEWIVSHLPEEADFIGIEGFSYGSSGNSFIDIVGYGYAIRMALVKKYGSEKFSVFSPGNVKKTAGKGNANKELIMQYFLESTSEDLRNNLFWQELTSGKILYSKNPCSDLIDAYYVQECARMLYTSKKKDDNL